VQGIARQGHAAKTGVVSAVAHSPRRGSTIREAIAEDRRGIAHSLHDRGRRCPSAVCHSVLFSDAPARGTSGIRPPYLLSTPRFIQSPLQACCLTTRTTVSA